MKLHRIEWIDIHSFNEWQSLKDLEENIKTVLTPFVCVGHILRHDKDFVIFTSGLRNGKLPEKDDEADIFGCHIIPTGVIKKITKL